MAEVSSTFMLRLWTNDEPRVGHPTHGRGRIDHLQSGERLYFDHLEDALSFIRYHFGAYDTIQPAAPVCSRCKQQVQKIDNLTKEDFA
jgi:hypothetical protein